MELKLLDENGLKEVRVFGGGGGVIIPDEKEKLEKLGIERIYLPDKGMQMGLKGMIDDVISRSQQSIADFCQDGEELEMSTVKRKKRKRQ